METISGTRNTLLSFGPLSTKGQHSNQIPRGSNLDHPSVQGESGRVRDKPGTREKCDRGQGTSPCKGHLSWVSFTLKYSGYSAHGFKTSVPTW